MSWPPPFTGIFASRRTSRGVKHRAVSEIAANEFACSILRRRAHWDPAKKALIVVLRDDRSGELASDGRRFKNRSRLDACATWAEESRDGGEPRLIGALCRLLNLMCVTPLNSHG